MQFLSSCTKSLATNCTPVNWEIMSLVTSPLLMASLLMWLLLFRLPFNLLSKQYPCSSSSVMTWFFMPTSLPTGSQARPKNNNRSSMTTTVKIILALNTNTKLVISSLFVATSMVKSSRTCPGQPLVYFPSFIYPILSMTPWSLILVVPIGFPLVIFMFLFYFDY